MILNALVQHYEDLVSRGEIEPLGWSPVKISYTLVLDENGKVERVQSEKRAVKQGNKTVFLSATMELPSPVKRSSQIAPNFLWDNSAYILGRDNKGNPERAEKYFKGCGAFYHKTLNTVGHPAVKALLKYFDSWNPADAESFPLFQDEGQDIFKANFVFMYKGEYLHEIPELKKVWNDRVAKGERAVQTCLVTGKEGPTVRVHPAIKGVAGAQSSGASLVSFQEPAFCSYGKKQGANAPISEYAAYAYSAALNHLIADKKHSFYMGNTLVMYWAKGGNPLYQDVFKKLLDEGILEIPETDGNERVSLDCPFYVLGISPNAGRIAVRFFENDSLQKIAVNLIAHQVRLNIVCPPYDKRKALSFGDLIKETISPFQKTSVPVMTGELIRAVLNNQPYPASFLSSVLLRIHADKVMNRERAAIIKAYYIMNPQHISKEVLTVSLNKEANDPGYNLGRLFAVLEAIQRTALPNIKSTIRDKFFVSAATTPQNVFSSLLKFYTTHHLKVIGRESFALRVYYEKLLNELSNKFETGFPTQLDLPQQGAFQLGYYHQRQEIYKPADTSTAPADASPIGTSQS